MHSDRLYSSAVQHRGATFPVSLTRGACHEDHILPRDRDCLRIHAADGLRVRASHRAGRKNRHQGTDGSQRGLAGMFQGSRRQGIEGQGAQEIPFRVQAGSEGRRREVGEVIPKSPPIEPSFQRRAHGKSGPANFLPDPRSSARQEHL